MPGWGAALRPWQDDKLMGPELGDPGDVQLELRVPVPTGCAAGRSSGIELLACQDSMWHQGDHGMPTRADALAWVVQWGQGQMLGAGASGDLA